MTGHDEESEGPTRDAAPDEGPKPPLWRRPRVVLAAIALLLVVSSPLWGPLLLRRLDFFRVRRVEIVGTRYITPGDILTRLNVDTMASIWDPTAPLAARVATHPQVRSATLRRRLPGTLVVELTEHLPIALVPSPQGFRVFDARGVPLPIDPSRVPVDAPVVARRDTALLRFLADVRATVPELYDRISEVVTVGRDQLVLRLDSLSVRAMRDVSMEHLTYIAAVESDLARRSLRATEIDLRFKDQVIARFP